MQETKNWAERSLIGKAFAYTLAVGILIFTIACPRPLWPKGPSQEPYR